MDDDPAPELYRVARTAAGLSHRNTLVLSRGEFPFVLFFTAGTKLHSDDLFTLEKSDGSYRESLPVSAARRGRFGHRVLWFRMPPAGGTFSMKITPARGGKHAAPYYIFRDQPATYFAEPEK